MITFYSNFHTHEWSLYLLPSINLYLESNSPYLHDKFMIDGINGGFLTIIFLKWQYTVGLYKKIT